MPFIAENITHNIKPSITLLAEAKATELKAKGINIISLTIGEPDFDTPDNIKLAAIDAINKGYTKYMAAGGNKALKQAVVTKLQKENNLEYNANQICVSSGAKQVIYNALMATINPGEEVIILAPYWVSYPEMVKIANGKPVIVDCNKNDFSLDIKAIEQAITPKTKWLIFNSPNNPTGYVYSYDELKTLTDILLKHEHVHVLSDEIYEHLIYDDNKFYSFAEIEPKLKNRVLIVNGLSKSYAMTGWRIGYAAGNEELIKAMTIVQSQSTSGACSISQMAAIEALNGVQNSVIERNKVYQKRRDLVFELIEQIEGLKCDKPKGAFYFYIDCSELLGKKTLAGKILENSNDITAYFLEEAHVAVVTGSAFGFEGYIRISYATSEDNLKLAFARIKEACDKLL